MGSCGRVVAGECGCRVQRGQEPGRPRSDPAHSPPHSSRGGSRASHFESTSPILWAMVAMFSVNTLRTEAEAEAPVFWPPDANN